MYHIFTNSKNMKVASVGGRVWTNLTGKSSQKQACDGKHKLGVSYGFQR